MARPKQIITKKRLVQVRYSNEEYDRIRKQAHKEHLQTSTWIRKITLERVNH